MSLKHPPPDESSPLKRIKTEEPEATEIETTPASQRVLQMPELLEMILLALPMKDLLLAQRVCKEWQTLMASSLRIGQALFLLPVKGGPVSYMDWRLDDKKWYEANGLEFNLGPNLRGPKGDEKPKIYPSHWGKTRTDAVLAADGLYFGENGNNLSVGARRPEASWRSMYFTAPPIYSMAVEYDSSDVSEGLVEWTVTQMWRSRKGMRMEDLWDELKSEDHPAWIEGRHLWEEYKGFEDLARCVVKGKEVIEEKANEPDAVEGTEE